MADFSLASIKTKVDKIRASIVDKKGSINKKNIYKNCTFIQNEFVNVYPYIEELKDIEKEKFLKENFYFTREDLVEEIGDLAFPKQEYEEIMKKLKPFISEQDLGALLYASKSCKIEDEGKKGKKGKIFTYNPFGEREKTLYNWLRSGEVFEKDLFPILNSLKKVDQSTELFLSIWDNYIKSHPFRVFVSKNMDEEELKDNILKRLILHGKKKIYVHSRGKTIFFSNKIINILIKEDLINFRLKKEDYTLGNSSARKFMIYK
ncbi:MAG: hypothetical protein KJ771_02475 [Nanoarchaeota archaeon]|nr:hypothetical protein [Nanoarchaeota archaeon]